MYKLWTCVQGYHAHRDLGRKHHLLEPNSLCSCVMNAKTEVVHPIFFDKVWYFGILSMIARAL